MILHFYHVDPGRLTFIVMQGLLSRLEKIRRRLSNVAPTMEERLADKIADTQEIDDE